MTRIGLGSSPLFLDPFAFAGASPGAAGGPTSGADVDAFLRAAGLSGDALSFVQGAQGAGMQLNPALLLATLGGLTAQDAGTMSDAGPWGVEQTQGIQGASRDELEQAIKDLFQELNAEGFPLEARPGSALAEAFATGDFSQVPPEDLAALLVALALYGQNRNNPGQVAQRPNMPLAPRGSWGGANGGNTYGGGTQHTGANAPAAAATGPAPTGTAPSSAGPLAGRIGDAAESVAHEMGSTGWCYRGVANALAREGITVSGGSAYMAADQLAAMPDKFQEVSVSPDELRNLPRGAVVVWGQTGASPHGHISVALGDGREASDHVQSQITSLRGASNYRVFIPQG